MTILIGTLLVLVCSSVLAIGGIAFIRSVIYFLLASVIPGVPQEASGVASLLAFVAIVAATGLNVGVLLIAVGVNTTLKEPMQPASVAVPPSPSAAPPAAPPAPAPTSPAPQPVCQKCGRVNTFGNKFCDKCGTRLE